MKKTHIIVLVLVAAIIGTIVSMTSDYSTYENFATATTKKGEELHVVGNLAEDDTMIYNPKKNPNRFVFHMIDKQGNKEKVVYSGAKPRDFERSEQIVLTGEMKDNYFSADKILMKCPSKYTKDTVQVDGGTQAQVSDIQTKGKSYD